jgi:hypothetical protein
MNFVKVNHADEMPEGANLVWAAVLYALSIDISMTWIGMVIWSFERLTSTS